MTHSKTCESEYNRFYELVGEPSISMSWSGNLISLCPGRNNDFFGMTTVGQTTVGQKTKCHLFLLLSTSIKFFIFFAFSLSPCLYCTSVLLYLFLFFICSFVHLFFCCLAPSSLVHLVQRICLTFEFCGRIIRG